MKKDLQKLQKEFEKAIHEVSDFLGLEAVEQQFFGRKSGLITKLMKGLKDLEKEAKKEMGLLANEVKQDLQSLLDGKRTELEDLKWQKLAEDEAIDITQPSLKSQKKGHIHPLNQAVQDLGDIAQSMGFIVEDGPELESDYYNFQAVNISPDHPARDGHDTFYIKDNPTWVMRTQTSNMQVRLMQKYNEGGTKPVRVMCPGRVFRNEALDATHEHTFYQLEGLIAGPNIHIGHLVATLKTLLQGIFKKEVDVRLRPSYFPFVEPGFELDMKVDLGKGEQWLEMLGCGLTHPNVVKAGGYDPEKWQAFAFGMGINRLVMAKHGIEDIRHFHSGDIRFLEQF